MRKKNGQKKRINLILPAYLLLLIVMFVLPYYSAEGYSPLLHTTSHLGAQHSPNAWIMNAVFILLGISCVAEAWLRLKGYWVHKILLSLFGAGLIFVALFRHRPLADAVPYSLFGDSMHSVFASAVGVSFTVFAVSAAFVEQGAFRKALALLTALMSVGFSVLMVAAADLTGLWQRALFILSFAWLLFFLEGMQRGTRQQVS